jgi:putative endonuclease
VKQPCIYILASKTYGTLYIGVTSDLAARLWQHRSGELQGFTSRYAVHQLVRFEQFATMHEAISREKQLKRWHRRWKINLIEGENPDWHDLAPSLGLPPISSR